MAKGRNGNVLYSCYRDILVVDCYREDIYRQLMRCYAACGRQADVKRTYRTCLEHLRRDLRLDSRSRDNHALSAIDPADNIIGCKLSEY